MVNEKLYNEIKEFCELNEIEDVEGLINQMLREGFTIRKYGLRPGQPQKNSKVEEIKEEPKPVEDKNISNVYNIEINKKTEDKPNQTDIYNDDNLFGSFGSNLLD